jgi:hypothetical protein
MTISNPPKPPFGSMMFYDKNGNLSVPKGFRRWTVRPAEATLHTLDHTGKRVSLTRVATLGVLSLGFKKKTGNVSVVIVKANGETFTHKVSAKHAEATLTWAVAFNAWREAISG